MHFTSRSKVSVAISLVALIVIVAGLFAMGALRGVTSGAHASSAASSHPHLSCAQTGSLCTEVYDSEAVFGKDVYVGHDEPSNLFYSNVPGSGNNMRYQLTLPRDPSPSNATERGKSFNFELHPTFWFGMALCDTQSFPEQLSTCSPDSDTNIVDPAISPKHAGTAFMELQFYPPGWIAPTFLVGTSCDPTRWCAAMTIDSLSENPVTGQVLNATCQAQVLGAVEYINFAFLTLNGVPQPNSPPDPLHSTVNTFTPNPASALFMNSGDQLSVTLHDTPHGLTTEVQDQTTGQTGSMTASAANGFAQVQFAPTGTSCNTIPYTFHPMYSTSSEKTRVTWAAHSYNVAFSDEVGHFDFCTGTGAISFGGSCPSTRVEGIRGDQEAPDVDDIGCFSANASTLVKVSGCSGTNTGFDGVSYQPLWPDGNTQLRPTPVQFSSPLTGSSYNVQYSRTAFETNLPRVEFSTCDRNTGVGCTLIPSTDDPGPLPPFDLQPAVFYPFFSITNSGGGCIWQEGNHIPGSKNDFGQNAEYGTLLNNTYTTVGGGPTTRYNDFRQILSKNPCQA
jgi:hypothetical protein